MKNLPNALTAVRFFLVPVFVVLFFFSEPWIALIVFISASFTDLLDGYLARKYNLITDWGKVMDPLADKIMLITVLTCLYFDDGAIPLFLLIAMAIKESLMVFGGIFLYKKKDKVVFSKIYGKLSTALFFIGVVFTFFRDHLYPVNEYVLYAALVISLFSFVMYGFTNFCRRSGKEVS